MSSTIAPWLALTLLLLRVLRLSRLNLSGGARLVAPGAVALAACVVPLGGFSLAEWVRGVNGNFSILLMVMLALACWEGAFSRRVLSQSDQDSVWIFGLVVGASLYPFALGIGAVDPYEWGWRFSILFVVVGIATGWLTWKNRPLGWMLLLAAIAFRLHVLESENYWDYLVDPIFVAASLVALTARLLLKSRQGRRPSTAVP